MCRLSTEKIEIKKLKEGEKSEEKIKNGRKLGGILLLMVWYFGVNKNIFSVYLKGITSNYHFKLIDCFENRG